MENQKRQDLERELGELTADLFYSASPVADFKPVKMLDAILRSEKFWQMFGDESLPYTKEQTIDFLNTREEKRVRIREIQKELDEISA